MHFTISKMYTIKIKHFCAPIALLSFWRCTFQWNRDLRGCFSPMHTVHVCVHRHTRVKNHCSELGNIKWKCTPFCSGFYVASVATKLLNSDVIQGRALSYTYSCEDSKFWFSEISEAKPETKVRVPVMFQSVSDKGWEGAEMASGPDVYRNRHDRNLTGVADRILISPF